MTFRRQLTVYLDEQQYETWEQVKRQIGEGASNSQLLWDLIREKHSQLDNEPSAIEDLQRRVKELEEWRRTLQ